MSNNHSVEQDKYIFIKNYWLRVWELLLKYFLARTYAGSGRLCGYAFMTFQVCSYETIQIIMSVEQICPIITLWHRRNLHLSRIIGFGIQEMTLNYFLLRTSTGSRRLCGYSFMTFQVNSYKTILIIISVEQICLIITLWNKLNLHLSRIMGSEYRKYH